jgi:hypothetical protein
MHPPNPSAGTSSRHKDIGSETTAGTGWETRLFLLQLVVCRCNVLGSEVINKGSEFTNLESVARKEKIFGSSHSAEVLTEKDETISAARVTSYSKKLIFSNVFRWTPKAGKF